MAALGRQASAALVAIAALAWLGGMTATSAALRRQAHRRAAPAGTAHRPTIVSLEFDHAFADQVPAVALANHDGLKVTVFAMSGRLGLPGYMTAADLLAVQAAGNEGGGHTIDHQDLSQLAPAAQYHAICDDRATLVADGLNVTDFAYPYGHFDAATPAIVRRCGYQSARGTGGLASPGGCYGECPTVESTPPADRFNTRTVNSVLDTTRLGTIESYVTRAQRYRGGWVQIVFHYVCDGCDLYSVSPKTLSYFLGWLAARQRAAQGKHRIRVETVRAVIGMPAPTSASRPRPKSGR